ncbi:hypothetical protein GCM10011506_21310 [Marivirga lumbricoides]|uniref:DUF481 domain-containing protein n=2 Tax=Marivirga lumbricoides TaxID=1046115 RepID=A0ABQ1M6A1_9BACT|nr:hypothetical protein GCM10011506_21310 [Marivirga lumbricoides]
MQLLFMNKKITKNRFNYNLKKIYTSTACCPLVLTILLSLLSLNTTKAQILNIERLRLKRDTITDFKMKLSAELTAYNRSAEADNPANYLGYSLNFNSLYYPNQHAYTLLGQFDYVKLNDANVVNYGYLHTRVNFLRKRVLSYEIFFQYSYDDFRGLNPRWLTGADVRIRLFEGEKTSVVISTGIMHEYEKWRVPVSEREVEANFIKSTNYLSIRHTFNELIDFNMIGYYQTGYDKEVDLFRNRLSSSIILNSKLTQSLSWKNSFDISYEDEPIVPITKLIYTFKTGISLDI